MADDAKKNAMAPRGRPDFGRHASPPQAPLPFDMYRIDITDLDRHGVVPWWRWARIVQNFRVNWFLGFVDTLGTDHVVVRSQALAMNPHASFSLGDVVQITTRLGRVGTTSFETWIEVREVDRATLEPGRVAMLGICVLVAVKNGRASQLSPKARALSNPTPFPMQVAVALSRTLRKSVEPLVGAGGACLRVPVAPRYSDEDTNLHVNQAHYLRFVEDAFTTLRESAPLAGAAGEVQRRAHEPMNAVIIEYAREASVAAGPFELLLEPAAEPPATVDAYLVKDTTVYCRVRYFTALPDLLAPVPLPKL